MHTAEIRPFPVAPRRPILAGISEEPPPHAAAAPARLAADMDFHELRHRLAMLDAQPRAVIDYIREITAKRGFPPPKNPRRWRRQWFHQCAQAVDRRSKWDRYLVERWLSGTLPPAAAQAVTERRVQDLRAQLAANANALAVAATA